MTYLSPNYAYCTKSSFHFAVTAANIDEFMELMNEASYPSNQRVLRFKELPSKCTAQDVRKYFNGLFLFQSFILYQKF